MTNEDLRLKVQRANDAALLKDKRFQGFILRLLDTAGIMRPNHRVDPVRSAFAEGRRALGIEVLNTLLAADEGAVQLIMPTAATVRALIAETTSPNESADDRDDQPLER
jgi:hypothetical protein